MSSAPLSDDIGRRAGFPWYYPVVFLLNLAIVVLIEFFAFYGTPLPLTEEALVKKEPAYAGAVIVNSTQSASVSWYLVETGDELHLIPYQRNIFLPDHGRLRSSQIVTIPADTAYMEVQTKMGINASTVIVGTDVELWSDEVQEHPLKMRSKYSGYGSGKYALTLYMFLALAMSIAEYIIWNKIKHG